MAKFPKCYLKVKKELKDQMFDLKNVVQLSKEPPDAAQGQTQPSVQHRVNNILNIKILTTKVHEKATNITAIHLKTKNNENEANLAYTAIILGVLSTFVYVAYCIFRASVTTRIYVWIFIVHAILDFLIFFFLVILTGLKATRESGGDRAGCPLKETTSYFAPLTTPNEIFLRFDFVTLRFLFYFLYMLPAFPGYAKDDYVPSDEYGNLNLFESPPTAGLPSLDNMRKYLPRMNGRGAARQRAPAHTA